MPSRHHDRSGFGRKFCQTVYFIQCGNGGPIKIGKTDEPPMNRLLSFQIGNPYSLCLLGTMKCYSRNTESMLHERFAKSRIRGEWFEPTEDLLIFIALNVTPFDEENPNGDPINDRMIDIRDDIVPPLPLN